MNRQEESAWRPSPNLHTFKVALHYPDLAFLFLTRRKPLEEIARKMVERDLESLRRRHANLWEGADSFMRQPQKLMQEALYRLFPSKPGLMGRMFNGWYSFLYSATRGLRPRLVVETGVHFGFSSAAILQALEDNGTRRLCSVDLPPESHQTVTDGWRSVQIGLPSSSMSVGFAVPLALRRRWDLHLGNSLDVLPELLGQLGPISMFIHDSLHTYDHMTAEFNLGYNALEKGGLLVSDDIDYNSAWADFCEMSGGLGVVLTKAVDWGPFGYLVKS